MNTSTRTWFELRYKDGTKPSFDATASLDEALRFRSVLREGVARFDIHRVTESWNGVDETLTAEVVA